MFPHLCSCRRPDRAFRRAALGLVPNPERDSDCVLAVEDEVVVLTSYAERDLAGLTVPNGASVTQSQNHSER
jgi:hypothetical protein